MGDTAKDYSRMNYTGSKNIDILKLGCLQRIADATEVISKNYQKLIDDYEYMRNSRDTANKQLRKVEH